MIRCDSERERKALADLLWAVKEVLVMRKNTPLVGPIADLDHALNRLFHAEKNSLDYVLKP